VCVCIYELHYRQHRKVAVCIPIQYDHTVQPSIADKEQLKMKQARLQWLFDNNMKCDEYITWGACLAGDISTLKWLVTVKKCNFDSRCGSH
jgi:hypothetical protein